MTRAVALALLLASCTKEYKVRVELTPSAVDRRLASGKSDSIDGFLRSSDGTGVSILVDGQLETVPRADIARVDQKLAKRDVTYGAAFAIIGGLVTIGSVFVYECGENEFPLFCSLKSERNLGATLAFFGGIALAGAGIKALFTGKAAQSRVDEILRGGMQAGWQLAPTVVTGQRAAPGVGLVVRY